MKRTLEEKIDKIKSLGVPLPKINYEYKGYESVVMQNKNLGGIRGIEVPEIHESFEDACDRVIEYYDN